MVCGGSESKEESWNDEGIRSMDGHYRHCGRDSGIDLPSFIAVGGGDISCCDRHTGDHAQVTQPPVVLRQPTVLL